VCRIYGPLLEAPRITTVTDRLGIGNTVGKDDFAVKILRIWQQYLQAKGAA
jgi:hypothetical protein